MSGTASDLNRVLKYLESKQHGLSMYAVAVEAAKHIHEDLPSEQRTERVRQAVLFAARILHKAEIPFRGSSRPDSRSHFNVLFFSRSSGHSFMPVQSISTFSM
ncbi:hypothetical protein MTO96_046768 [Rhipicephalus appendiculatus]